jgi:hypothetical protein
MKSGGLFYCHRGRPISRTLYPELVEGSALKAEQQGFKVHLAKQKMIKSHSPAQGVVGNAILESKKRIFDCGRCPF